MSALPKAVVVGYRTYRIKPLSKAEANRSQISGDCSNANHLIRVRTEGQTGPEVANTLLHEIFHACWDVAGIGKRTSEERVVHMLTDQMTQVIRDNPKVFDWIAEKARS